MFGMMIDTAPKFLHSTIPTPIHDLKVKVMDFHVKVLHYIPNPVHDFKVKVRDLEFLY